MPEVVGVRFRKSGKIYDFDPQSLELKSGDRVVVETACGAELGEVAIVKQNCNPEPDTALKPVLRLATKEDAERADSLLPKEEEALKECNKLVTKLELPMKLISAEYSLDASHLTIFFGAENRVDFRELVRELSHHLKVRVELRQIGPRDEAKLLGGSIRFP
jgi:cell fate regulator YaaT (PSP1 superfamily)